MVVFVTQNETSDLSWENPFMNHLLTVSILLFCTEPLYLSVAFVSAVLEALEFETAQITERSTRPPDIHKPAEQQMSFLTSHTHALSAVQKIISV